VITLVLHGELRQFSRAQRPSSSRNSNSGSRRSNSGRSNRSSSRSVRRCRNRRVRSSRLATKERADNGRSSAATKLRSTR